MSSVDVMKENVEDFIPKIGLPIASKIIVRS